MHVFYLHGFASSPHSTKASMVAERLRADGLTLHCPDFNEPDFSSLTVTRMIEQTRRAIADLSPAPVTLIGSSLGGFVAVHLAALPPPHPGSNVDRLVLLAPALDFGRSGMAQLGPDGLARWRETNRLEVFHYGFGKVLSVQYALHEDAGRYDAFALRLEQPTLVYQGRRDQAVDPDMVKRYAQARPNVTLHTLDDDHQLVASMPQILDGIEAFVGL
jgi:pimeloyl-ACP methyl ester carboxylesterase